MSVAKRCFPSAIPQSLLHLVNDVPFGAGKGQQGNDQRQCAHQPAETGNVPLTERVRMMVIRQQSRGPKLIRPLPAEPVFLSGNCQGGNSIGFMPESNGAPLMIMDLSPIAFPMRIEGCGPENGSIMIDGAFLGESCTGWWDLVHEGDGLPVAVKELSARAAGSYVAVVCCGWRPPALSSVVFHVLARPHRLDREVKPRLNLCMLETSPPDKGTASLTVAASCAMVIATCCAMAEN